MLKGKKLNWSKLKIQSKIQDDCLLIIKFHMHL